MTFGTGTANFFFDTDRSWSSPIKIEFRSEGKPALTLDAGAGGSNAMAVTAYVQLETLIAAAAKADALGWTISGPTEKRKKGSPIIGRYSMAALREAEAAMPVLIARFDAMQADYRTSCNMLG